MPELPEVETLCRQLRPVIVGTEISQIHVLDTKLRGFEGIQGREIMRVTRHGKALEMELEGGLSLLFHFRMTGRLLWQDRNGLLPHTRLVIFLPLGRISLIDPRRFATVTLYNEGNTVPLGRDPLADFDPSHLWNMAQQCTLPVKSFLMDQRRIAGIGNIYACEILHQARIDPWRRINGLSQNEWIMIGKAAGEILTKAIACRGTSVSDWRDLFGRTGEHQHNLMVYGREGTGCFRCGETVERRKLNGRGTYFCPSCQNYEGGS